MCAGLFCMLRGRNFLVVVVVESICKGSLKSRVVTVVFLCFMVCFELMSFK